MSEQELEDYYQAAIGPGLNILLIGIQSPLRSGDIRGFSSGLARVYSIRDFRDDWEKGIINIPEEILTKAELTTNTDSELVSNHPIITEWMQDSLEKGQRELAEIQSDPRLASDRLTARILGGLIRSAQKHQK